MAVRGREPPAVPGRLSQHTIFLSHSGDEKAFVEQLYEDLKRVNHKAFFDQDSDSLPKGERFPALIFEAAKQCQLAVVVLSKGYLTSKWPMLELSAFVRAKKTNNPNLKLFPLFYKLSPSDLDVEKEAEWAESWKGLVQDGKVDAGEIVLWSEALKCLLDAKNVETAESKALTEQLVQGEVNAGEVSTLFSEVVRGLRAFNGLEFKQFRNSEVKFRAAVVDEICKCVAPMMEYKTDHVRGYQRMCEAISSMFEEGVCEDRSSSICKQGRLYLGLYGMGGVGKTTLCEAMCSYFQAECRGRVCHVELPSDSSGDRVVRLKHAVQQLAGYEDKVVDMITSESQGLKCLESRLKDQPAVFLAVDNVGDAESSREEARSYVNAGFACGSKVLVTSRSRVILESILGGAEYCKPVPRLEELEACEVFLSAADPNRSLSSLGPVDFSIVKACVGECQFADDGYPTGQYHPLVLRALGTYFHDVKKDGMMSWKEALSRKNKVRSCRELKHVNDILGLNYQSLSDIQKLIFLDVAFLFNTRVTDDRLLWSTVERYSRDWWDGRSLYDWQVSFIATLHGVDVPEATMKVGELRRKSLINECGSSLTMHELYLEFARSLIEKEGSVERAWWVGHVEKTTADIPQMKRLLVDSSKSVMCRVPENLQECRNLVCLFLLRCVDFVGGTLDLGQLNNLRVLIVFCCKMQAIVCSCYKERNGLSCSKEDGRGCMSELRIVKLRGCYGLERAPFLSHCGNLSDLRISGCYRLSPVNFTRGGSLLLEKNKLEVLSLYSAFDYRLHEMSTFYDILRCTSEFKNLRVLEVRLAFNTSSSNWGLADRGIVNLSLLVPFSSLTVLSLVGLPDFVEELKGLDRLSQLTTLNLRSSRGLRKLPDLHLLPHLQRVCVHECCRLEDLTAQLTRFQEIMLEGEDVVDIAFCPGDDDHGYHKCVEPQCNWSGCFVCVERHLECGCHWSEEMLCDICCHLTEEPRCSGYSSDDLWPFCYVCLDILYAYYIGRFAIFAITSEGSPVVTGTWRMILALSVLYVWANCAKGPLS